MTEDCQPWAAHRREHELNERALELARTELDRRLESMNELRDQIARERADYLTHANFDGRHEALIDRINVLERARANLEGRLWVIGALIVVLELTLRFIHI